VGKDEKEAADEAKKRDFVFATTALAKQMMETTQDAATNAKTVLGYNLPAKFADLEDGSEAKEMVKQGNFYGIAKKILRCTRVEVSQCPIRAICLPTLWTVPIRPLWRIRRLVATKTHILKPSTTIKRNSNKSSTGQRRGKHGQRQTNNNNWKKKSLVETY
jgi:hypothetical protein